MKEECGESEELVAESLTRRGMLIKAGGVCATLALEGLVSPFRIAAATLATEQPVIPGKERLTVKSARPLNLETPIELLDSWITPTSLHFVRNHYDVPTVSPEYWRLRVDGLVKKPLTLTLDDLKRLPAVESVATLECAGNGRAFFDPKVPGTQWRRGAVGTARYRGVRLADVLGRAHVKESAKHVLLDGADQPPVPTAPDFARTVPLEKALDPDTLLAFEMNGEPLPAVHGFPLRALVPGWVGAAHVKWLVRISLLEREHDGHFMAKSYRLPRSPVGPDDQIDPNDTTAVTGLEVKSVIAHPADGARVRAGTVRIAGATWAGVEEVERVEVSTDFGRTWQSARLGADRARYAWRLWEFDWEVRQRGTYSILSRAIDSKGQTQPIAQRWNPQGYLWNVVDHIRIHVDG